MINRKSKCGSVLPPNVITTNEARRLYALANSNMALFPCEAFFLACEMNRANVVPDNADLRGVVHMGSQVRYCDGKTGDVLVKIDPRYFRPTEVELLLGDPSKARKVLGWAHEITFPNLVKEMVASDLKVVLAEGRRNS